MVLVSFETACWLGEQSVCRLETSFGFFRGDAWLGRSACRPLRRNATGWTPGESSVELTSRPPRYFAGPLRLPQGQPRMIDRVPGYWPEGGKAGLGRLLAEQTVDPARLGTSRPTSTGPGPARLAGGGGDAPAAASVCDRERDARGCEQPEIRANCFGQAGTWKYRGQVIPRNKKVQVEMEVTETGRDEGRTPWQTLGCG